MHSVIESMQAKLAIRAAGAAWNCNPS